MNQDDDSLSHPCRRQTALSIACFVLLRVTMVIEAECNRLQTCVVLSKATLSSDNVTLVESAVTISNFLLT